MAVKAFICFLLRHRNSLLFTWFSILLFALFFTGYRLVTTDTLIDNSVGVWFDLKDPEISLYEHYNNSFGEKEWTILILKTQSVFESKFLSELNDITQSIENLDHVVKVTSITNVRDNWKNPDNDLDYRKLFNEELLKKEPAQFLQTFKNQLISNPVFDKNIINKADERFTAVLIQNDNFIRDTSDYRIKLVNQINQILQAKNSINDWGLAGTTIVNAELNKAAQKDVIVFYSLVSFLLGVICWLIMQSFKDLLVILSVVISSVLISMLALALLDIPYNMANVMLPPILIALSVAGVLHIITDFHLAHGRSDVRQALIETYEKLWVPSLWAGLTTFAGLASFGFSTISPFFQLGIIGSLGILVALLTSMTIVPLLIHVLWNTEIKQAKKKQAFSIKSRKRNFLRRPRVLSLLLIFLLLLITGLHKTEVDTDYSKFFSSNTKITHSYDLLDQAQMGQNPIIIQLVYPPNQAYMSQPYFKAVYSFEDAIKTLPEVTKVLSVTDLLQQLDASYNDLPVSAQRLKNYTQEQLSQLLLLAELSGNDDIDDLLLKSRTAQQIVAITSYLSSKQLHTFRQKIALLQERLLPDDIVVNITGTTVLWANMDTQITQTQIYTLAFIGLFVIILLPWLFGSFWLGLLGVLINGLPLAATIGLMSWLDIKINMATVVIGAISIGIVVDDTIHMFYRIQKNRKSGQDWTTSINKSLSSIGTSIYRTSLILIVAFSAMATSDFLPTAHFGIFVSISVAIALFLDLFVAPAILFYLTKDRGGLSQGN